MVLRTFRSKPNPDYNQTPPYNNRPVVPMYKTNRSLLTLILLSLITFGIYDLYFFTKVGTDINQIASRRDGRHSMHFLLLTFIISPITCGIGGLVWYSNISQRIGNEARVRGNATNFSSSTFWLWAILGSLLFGIGPLVYYHKLCVTINYICASYNQNGY